MTRTWTRRLAVAGVLLGAIVVLWLLFWPVTYWLGGADLDHLGPQDRLAAVGTIRGQVGAVLSAAFVGGGLYYTGRKFFLDRDKQFTDRFNSAIDHLGSGEETVRAGGIRALDRILHDSPGDRNRVLESLTGFLRHRTPGSGRSGDDVNAAVAALRGRGLPSKRTTENALDLRGVRLSEANLRGISLRQADFGQADLTGAVLAGADLRTARLHQTTLINADLSGADLTGADLRGARVVRADLTGAVLTGADLAETDFSGANLTGADLRAADLTRASGLTAEQIEPATTDPETTLPPHLGPTPA
ncbi:pentapeptide repeat-containing protein [Amycolatopsis saalfeldensis]|uniref:Pentapeptide repeat-containing protein n=1 Tax=Amycolatopsis saalfeldensis TaxID=394193 RepID=A0A1H8REB5_9PSEU|nr:pentapeptide repeat-containing protein [Amycolatopsis saalfeldensis]SEO64730.1 Pentapeptide repeat-containing protein [Amycolatopsis saalfeldensis]